MFVLFTKYYTKFITYINMNYDEYESEFYDHSLDPFNNYE